MPGASALDLVREGWSHLHAQRPLAAWSSWQRALRLDPNDAAALKAIKALETAEELPAAARAAYRFQAPDDDSARSRWDVRLRAEALEDLDRAAEAFAGLAADDPSDALALLNLALCRAWQGRNAEAVNALDSAVSRLVVTNPDRASEAWTLAEVLRLGAGAEPLADDLRYVWEADQETASGPTDDLFQRWPNLREVPAPVDPLSGGKALESARVYEWLDRPWPGVPGYEAAVPSTGLARVLATVVRAPGMLRLSTPEPSGFDALEGPLLEEVATALRKASREAIPLPIAWADAALGTYRLPPTQAPGTGAASRAAVEHYYENIWLHQSRKSLGGLTPLAASGGDAASKAKLSGVVRFREQLGARATHAGLYQGYPFDRLRRRLGLIGPEESAALDADDVTCMSGEELDRIGAEAMDVHRLTDALHSAAGLRDDARITRFARAWLAKRPGTIDGPEWESFVAAMVREALRESGPTDALEVLRTAGSVASDRQTQGVFQVWSAELLAREGHATEALNRFQIALSDFPPHQAASVAIDGAETLLENGHPREAVALLQDALARSRALGDAYREGRAATLLRELGEP